MNVRKVVTFRAPSIGDALNAKYFFENIHAEYPGARCALVIPRRRESIRDLLSSYPWIEVIEVNRMDVTSIFRLIVGFWRSDIVVTPSTKSGGIFSLGSKIVARLIARPGGFVGFRDRWMFNSLVYDRLLLPDMSVAPRILEQQVLHALGIPISIQDMRLSIEETSILERLSLTRDSYVVMHLFAGSENRALSQRRRQDLINAVSRRVPGTVLLLTGTEVDRPYLEQLQLPDPARNIAGMLSLRDLATLIRSSACTVSIGSGPSHLASHLGVRPVVLVVCYGLPWCGEEEFGESAGYLFTNRDACGSVHNGRSLFPPCIEHIPMDRVADRVATLITRPQGQHDIPHAGII